MWRSDPLLSKATAKIPQQQDQELREKIQLGISNTAPFSTLSLPYLVLNKSSQLSISKSSLTTPCLHGTACFSQPSPWGGKITPEPPGKKPVLLSWSPLFIQQAALYTRTENNMFSYTRDEVRLIW